LFVGGRFAYGRRHGRRGRAHRPAARRPGQRDRAVRRGRRARPGRGQGDEITRLAGAAGWSFGNRHSGHLVGEFPHEEIDGDKIESYIAPGNDTPMRRHDKAGRVCHWILEIHLTDTERQFGGFYEQLLDLG
jgi:hypothetical protein